MTTGAAFRACFIIVVFGIQLSSGIRCYQCSSAEDKKGEDSCGVYDSFDPSKTQAVECNSDESVTPGTFCVKIVKQSPRGFVWDGRWRQVIRRCGSVSDVGVTGVCNWGLDENSVYWEECYCSEDSCNNASHLGRTALIIFVPMLVMAFYRISASSMALQQCPMCLGSGAVSCSALLSQCYPDVCNWDRSELERRATTSNLDVENVNVITDDGVLRLVVTFQLKRVECFGGEEPQPDPSMTSSIVTHGSSEVTVKREEYCELASLPSTSTSSTVIQANSNDIDAALISSSQPPSDTKVPALTDVIPSTFCSDCALQFTSTTHQKFHVATVHENRLNCCSSVFFTVETHLMHLREVHGVSVFLCHLCPKAFKNKGTWTVHQRMFHGVRSGCVKRQKSTLMIDPVSGSTLHAFCSVCSEEIKDAAACKRHSEAHNGKPQWPCSVCFKNFSSKAFLRNHVKLHTGETPYECKVCGRTFTFKQSVTKHMLYHSEERPFKCEDCDRSFRENTTLQNHRRIHTGEKPFTCDDCGKKFRQKVAWIVHRRIHTNEAPYICPVCDRTFRYKVSLRSHRCRGGKRAESALDGLARQPSGSGNSYEPAVKFEANEAAQSPLNLDLFVLQEADRLLGLSISDNQDEKPGCV